MQDAWESKNAGKIQCKPITVNIANTKETNYARRQAEWKDSISVHLEVEGKMELDATTRSRMH